MNIISLIKKLFHKSSSPTLQQMKDKWSAQHYPNLSEGGRKGYEHGWIYIPQEMRDRKFLDLKYQDWQDVVDKIRDLGKTYSTQKRVKNLCGQLYTYAIKHELTDKNYAPYLVLVKNKPKQLKIPFSEREINFLWSKVHYTRYVDVILILIYTGLRASELLNLKLEDINFEYKYFIVKQSKTEAGRNRIIPIHPRILPFFKKYAQFRNVYLITNKDGEKLSYSRLRSRLLEVNKKFNMKHSLHECRHTFASRLDAVGTNERVTQLLMGHAGSNITQKVYIHKRIKELVAAIESLE